MKKLGTALIAAAVLFITACGSPSQVKDNTLTRTEKEEGYTLLFNGMDFTGWRMFNGGEVTGWLVEDGCMVGLGHGGDIGGDIVTIDDYGDFQIMWDWKIGPQGNSGFMYHVLEGPQYKAPYETGPEYQMIDDDNYPIVSETGKPGLEEWQKTGTNYAMHLPVHKSVNPPGEWNSAMLIYNKGHVEHWLNGEKILEFQERTDDWFERRNSGKWDGYPDYGKSTVGKLCFQDHGSKVYFKNVKVKKL